jgi:hypothetical protein
MTSGAQNFTEAALRTQMNPTQLGGVVSYTGSVKLLEITTSNALVSFNFTRGANLSPPANMMGYSGYYLTASAFGGAAIKSDYVVGTALQPNTWTDVKLDWLASTGNMKLTYNGITIVNQTGYGSTDTQVKFTVGSLASGQVSVSESMRFDDVECTVSR